MQQPSLEGLAEDVASLKRVRNRFSRSSDEKLGTIVPALLPKLFQRLEKYSMLVANEDNDESPPLDNPALTNLKEARDNVYGIIANALERLRGNESIPVESLAAAMLPFVDSPNPVVGTWALVFLQVLIRRIPLANVSWGSSAIPPLLESLGRLHKRLAAQATTEEEISTTNGPLEARWVGVSWLLLDSIVHDSGQKPMVDWDIDSFDDSQRFTRRQTNRCSRSSSSSLERDSVERSRHTISRDAARGFFSLLMDLLLYWPAPSPGRGNTTTILSPIGMRRMEHRSKIFSTHNDFDDGEEHIFPPIDARPDLPPQFQRARFRRRTTTTTTTTRWSDASKAYLRYMKLACLEFAISPDGRELLRELHGDYSVVLSILFAGHESMHGRIAFSYLKKWSAENPLLPLSVATDALALAIGEARVEELLDSFGRRHDSGIIRGRLLLGSKCNNQDIQRPPIIDPAARLRAMDFLLEHSLKWRGSAKTLNNINKSCAGSDDGACDDEARAALLIELSHKLSEANDDEHKFLAMRLVSNFYCRLKRPERTIVGKIFDLITEVLTILVNTGIEEDLRTTPRPNNRTAPIPVPFHARNDLNKLLQSHRLSLKRKNLNRDNAIHARMDAYTMIPLLSAYILDLTNAAKFQLPILLFRCAGFEDRCLESYLTKALDSTLARYKKKFDEDRSLFISKGCEDDDGMTPQQQTTFMLPALLEAVSSESANVRMNAIQWIQELLVNMDNEAAACLAAYLVHDENSKIARIAAAILDNAATTLPLPPDIIRDVLPVTMIDLKSSDGLIKVQDDLKNRSKALAQRLQISYEESIVLLLQFKFSVERVELEYCNNESACRELCGIIDPEQNIATTEEEASDGGGECGICYGELGLDDAYSLRCGHNFCKDCWRSYATEASNETLLLMNFLDLRCPHHGCGSRVMPHDLQQLESSSRLVPKWNDSILRKFIEDDASYRYCPGPDCGCVAMRSTSKSIAAVTPNSQKVVCGACRTSFCFGCGQNEHAPASCQDIIRWNHLKGSSQFWIKHNSKPCPGCNTPIEKNQGCNHMRCAHCETHFCWLCLTVMNSYMEPHTCHRYNSADSAEDDFERQALFIMPRYDAHDSAALFTMDQYKSFDPEKLLQRCWFLDDDVENDHPDVVYKAALETLLAGRDFLKHSYVAMLGLRKDAKRLKLHEDHHACLEMFTERLSQLTETNLHRLFALQGHAGIRLHFRRMDFYTASVAKYMERMMLSISDTGAHPNIA